MKIMERVFPTYKVVIEDDTDSDPEDVFSDAYNGIEKDPQEQLDREFELHRVEGRVFYWRPKVYRMSEEESLDFYERLMKFREKCHRLDLEEAEFRRKNGFPDAKARIPGMPVRAFRSSYNPELEVVAKDHAQ